MGQVMFNQEKTPTDKQTEFRKRRRQQGQVRAEAFYRLMRVHNLNLPALDEYVNAKDDNGMPLHPDIDEIILPEPTKIISRSRIHQILMRVPQYMSNSSWKTTRKRVQDSEGTNNEESRSGTNKTR